MTALYPGYFFMLNRFLIPENLKNDVFTIKNNVFKHKGQNKRHQRLGQRTRGWCDPHVWSLCCKICRPVNVWFAVSGPGERVFFVFKQFNNKYNYSNYFVAVWYSAVFMLKTSFLELLDIKNRFSVKKYPRHGAVMMYWAIWLSQCAFYRKC